MEVFAAPAPARQPESSITIITASNYRLLPGNRGADLSMLGNLPVAVLQYGNNEVVLTLFGCHVCSCIIDGRQLFYMSPNSFNDGKLALRGGSPLVGPWFGADPQGSPDMHGVLRTANFEFNEQRAFTAPNSVSGSFELVPSDLTMQRLGKGCVIICSVSLDLTGMTTALTVDNRAGKSPMNGVVFGFHDYQLLPGQGQAYFYGLTGDYTDRSSTTPVERRESDSRLYLPTNQEVNRLFRSPNMRPDHPLEIHDPVAQALIKLFPMQNLQQACWWHPANRSNMHDLPPEQYSKFVCVELLGRPRVISTGESGLVTYIRRATIEALPGGGMAV